ncbi:efflux RND transporter periplasmic adaptor subunit [Acinetobacter sp. ANC 4648]|uniref:efflux RND transporter periplasmic adaptor subunit n=1 Tax=Acinetobacter sp. ANC 4648 TaxID=1977875 RepID=UPI000A34DD3B|nr:efflux RND transporter periplasmic adaptor subunit [Acinetobacter sp. ANC 4648]OTG82959.1 efflux transporter periplasmic adaptor subunit [Acinetobacter sp. ANC 4648]
MNNSSEETEVVKKPSKIKGIISYLIVLIILFLVAWGIWHLTHKSVQSTQGSDQSKKGGANSAPTVVGVATVVQKDINSSIQALGTVTSSNTVVVHPLVSGVLMHVYFKEGSFVQKGQLLAQIDDRAPKAALLQSQGQLLRDQALLSNAKLDLQRYAQLWKQDSIAKQQYDTQASLVQQYQGVVKTDQAAVDNAKLQLSYTQVTAPAAGRIGLRQVDAGNMVNTTDPNGIANITQLKNISVVFAVPEQYLTQLIQLMDDPQQIIPIQAWDRQNSQKLADGKLLALDNQVNTSTGTINIKAEFDNHNQHLFPNQFVNIQMQVGKIFNALIVPTVALQLGSNGSFVYKVNPDHTVTVVNVTTGTVIGDNTVLIQGAIQANDQVVTDGVDKLKDGAKVRLGDVVPKSDHIKATMKSEQSLESNLHVCCTKSFTQSSARKK